MHRLALASVVSLLAFPVTAPAQSAEHEVIHVITQLFDGMRAGDSAAVRAAFHPEARLLTALDDGDDGRSRLDTGSLERFVQAVGTPHEEVWDERLSGTEVRVDGPMASVWAPYAFYLGDSFHHCGVNAFQLFRDADGWRIVHLIDTRQRVGCPGEE